MNDLVSTVDIKISLAFYKGVRILDDDNDFMACGCFT